MGGVDGEPGEAEQAGGAAAGECRDGRPSGEQAGVLPKGVADRPCVLHRPGMRYRAARLTMRGPSPLVWSMRCSPPATDRGPCTIPRSIVKYEQVII